MLRQKALFDPQFAAWIADDGESAPEQDLRGLRIVIRPPRFSKRLEARKGTPEYFSRPRVLITWAIAIK